MEKEKGEIPQITISRNYSNSSLTPEISSHLAHELKEKNELLTKYEQKLKTVQVDFNYNVDLIYERDREIHMLNARIEELISLNQEKDAEILRLQQSCSRVKQLEHDKAILSKRIEALLAGSVQSKTGSRKTPAPRTESYSENIGYKGVHHKKQISVERSMFLGDESGMVPLTKLNFDLERRIKALEQETEGKRTSSRNLFYGESEGKSIGRTREKVQHQEKEISELINSLHPYKKEIVGGSYEKHLASLNKDIERLKTEISRPSSRNKYARESIGDEKKHESIRGVAFDGEKYKV